MDGLSALWKRSLPRSIWAHSKIDRRLAQPGSLARPDRRLLQWRIDLLTDHSIHLYAEHIATAVQAEDAALGRGREEKDADALAIREGQQDESCQNSVSA